MTNPRNYVPGSEEFEGPTLYPTTVRGYRAFSWRPDGTLTGTAQQGFQWRPGWNDATCHPPMMAMTTWWSTGSPRPEHKAPVNGCGCGFWAYWTGENDRVYGGNLSGVIEAKGRAIVGTLGMRVEKARIVALVQPDAITAVSRLSAAQRRMWKIIPLDVAVLAAVQCAILHFTPFAPWGDMLVTLPFALAYALIAGVLMVVLQETKKSKEKVASFEERWAKTLAKYDVKVYESEEEMLAAHPVTDPRA